MPLAGAAFVAMLELTLVSEGWPLRRLGRFTAGVAALAFAWVVALAVYLLAVDFDAPPGSGLASRHGPLSGEVLGAILVVIGAWQVWWFVAWSGWPFTSVQRRWLRLLAANAVVLGGGVLTYVASHDVAGVDPATISAVAGTVVAAGLLVGMLFEGWLHARLPPAGERAATLAAVAALAVPLYLLLRDYADTVDWTRAGAEEWIGHAGLNAIGVGIILHVAIGRRWPFGGALSAPSAP